MDEGQKKGRFAAFLKRKGIEVSAKRYLIDAMSSMVLGLFASLLIGTILGTLADKLGWTWLAEIAAFAKAVTGPAIAVSISYALAAPPLVLVSLCAVGYGSYELGGPLCTLICAILATEVGKLVSKETKIDILVTPAVTVLFGILLAKLIGPGVDAIMTGLGNVIMRATELRPFLMGMVVSAIVGMTLTLPISSAALCMALGLVGLAGGAATAGCCAQMVGFAVMSFRENSWGGLAAQGLGTAKLQMANIMKNPVVWIPPVLTSMITGPISTCVFRLENGVAVASGMGTCGLVGPIGIMTWEGFGPWRTWLGLALVCFVLPAVLTPLIAWPLRRLKWIRENDLRLEL
ncbi:MAG TPA: PTS sugar transporter subunit IIC [Clostridia bacterium]|nr:PTS sugar transporter subunit IIC [Clostridia bacterium]